MYISELIKKYDKIFLVQSNYKDDYIEEMVKRCNELRKNVLFIDNEEILDIYTTYEFSDKINLLTNSNQYGNIFNFVRAGVLTIDEAIEALLS